jgi:transcriptional regulator with XRE-family HTH domain
MVAVKNISPRPQLTRARRLKGLTRTRLARNLRVTVAAVSAWEGGHRKPSDAIIPDLADELGTTRETLLDWIDAPSN